MAKVGCSTYHRGADGYYRTMEIGRKPKEPPPRQLSERAIRSAEKRASDAEVCRRCTKTECKGSARCIEKERAWQERELNKNGETDG